MYGGESYGDRDSHYLLDIDKMQWRREFWHISQVNEPPSGCCIAGSFDNNVARTVYTGVPGKAVMVNDDGVYFLPVSQHEPFPTTEIEMLRVFENDTIVMTDNTEVLISSMDLCTGITPCALTVQGTNSVAIRSPAMSCHEKNGCTRLSLESVHVQGIASQMMSHALIDVSGSVSLNLADSKFESFFSESDGSIVRAYSLANVEIRTSTFEHSSSLRSGGCLASLGATFFIAGSNLINCTAHADGGAVGNIPLTIPDPDGFFPKLTLVDTRIENCTALARGGGVSINEGDMIVLSSTFTGNKAMGIGGGAMHVSRSSAEICYTTMTGNSAPVGGGGGLLWDGDTAPAICLPCPVGSYLNVSNEGKLLCQSSMVPEASVWPKSATDGLHHLLSGLSKSALTLTEHTKWLCIWAPLADNNTAAYGPCVATLFSGLELIGVAESQAPGFAGLPMELVVTKRDVYRQRLVTDSTSKLQLKSAKDGTKEINDPSISFQGSTFAGFTEGRASFRIAIKPTFSSLSELEGSTSLLTQPFIYAEGIDVLSASSTSSVMESEVQQVHLATGNLTVCPIGYVLVLDPSSDGGPSPGACIMCQVGKYSSNPLTGLCRRCPPSAVCTNGAPPVFAAVTITGSIEMVLPDDLADDSIRQAIATRLGVESWRVSLPAAGLQRRSAQQVQFTLVASQAQMQELSTRFTSMGIQVGKVDEGASDNQVAEGEVWEETGGLFLLRSCPPGHQLINTTESGMVDLDAQECRPCGALTYIIDQLGPCFKCPKGGDCSDITKFVPLANGSIWEDAVLSDNSGIRKRVVECPPGYALERDEEYPDLDNCAICEVNSYRLDRSYVNSSKPHCTPCDPKLNFDCRGGNIVEAKKGYWRFAPLTWKEDDQYEYVPGAACPQEGYPCLFPEVKTLVAGWAESAMTCMKLSGGGMKLYCARLRTSSSRRKPSKGTSTEFGASMTMDDTNSSATAFDSKVLVFRCPIGACNVSNQCLQNRTGPVCGLCLPGFVMEAAGCSAKPCPDDSDIRPWRIAFFVVIATVVFFLWLAFAWRPVLPELDWLMARMLQGVVMALSSFVCFTDAQGDTSSSISELFALFTAMLGMFSWLAAKARQIYEWAQQNKLPQFLKIFVTYAQILGSFTMFSIKWPDIAMSMLTSLKGIFKFELLQMPGMSCILQGYSAFDQTLHLYTIAPLLFLVALFLPVPVALLRGFHMSDKGARWRQALDKFWTNTVSQVLSRCLCASPPALILAHLVLVCNGKELTTWNPAREHRCLFFS